MMQRTPNSDRTGNKWSEELKLSVWGKSTPTSNPSLRLDTCGAVMEWSKFGTTVQNGSGWEIDHIVPVAHGGGDELNNLQALQWEHNRRKSDSLSNNYCFLSQAAR
jgi:hypothetical protein